MVKRYLLNLNRILNSSHLLKVSMILMAYLYVGQPLILLFGTLYLLACHHRSEIIILMIMVILIMGRNQLFCLTGDHYVITSLNDTSFIATNCNYQIRVYTEEKYRLGDVIKTDHLHHYDRISDNIRYYHDDKVSYLFHIPNLRNDLYHRLWPKEDQLSLFLKDLLFDNFYDGLEFNLSWYFFFQILKSGIAWFTSDRKAVWIAVFSLFNLLGLNYIFLRIALIETLGLFTRRKDLVLIYSGFILILIAPDVIHSYSFIIPFLLRFIYLFKTDLSFKALIAIIQSCFFNSVNLLQIVFFKKMMYLTFFLTVLGLLDLYCSFLPQFVRGDLLLALDWLNQGLIIRGQISWLVLLILFFGLFYFKIKNHLSQLLLVLLLLASNISNIFGSVTFIDVGQGDAILIKTPFNSATILIDTGSPYNYYKLDRFLKRQGIYVIDYLIITHPDNDHSGNVLALFEDYQVKDVILEAKDLSICGLDLLALSHQNGDDTNDRSLVYYLNYDGITFLFTGDISSAVEKDIINHYAYLKPKILKVSHHGSKTATSDYFLASFPFALAIISTSGQYGHPHAEVIERLLKWQLRFLSTKEAGSISFVFTNLFDFYICDNGEFGIIN